jgi:hypothetical protein
MIKFVLSSCKCLQFNYFIFACVICNLNFDIYIYIKRVLCVLFLGVVVPVSNTRIFVSSVSRVLMSGDLDCYVFSFGSLARSTK